jgi:superfamily I DNA/RNA helicase
MTTHLILGPPGTGKTTRLLEILEKELLTNAPEQVAFLTFTRAARAEARSRVPHLDLPHVKTLHSACYHQLGITTGEMASNSDLVKFGKSIGVDLTGVQVDPWDEEAHQWKEPTDADDLLRINHLGRHRLTTLKSELLEEQSELSWMYAKWVTESYRYWKQAEEKIDYTDLLSRYLERGRPLNIKVGIVDEAQDLSKLQWKVADLLLSNCERVYIAGDPNQEIFSWAGADARRLREKVDVREVLATSHRLPRKVHALAAEIVDRCRDYERLEFNPRDDNGSVQPLQEITSDLFRSSSTLLLYRNHFFGRLLKTKLEDLGIPHVGPGTTLEDDTVRLALTGWLGLHREGTVDAEQARALKRACPKVVNLCRQSRRYSVEELFETLPKMEEWATTLTKLPNLDYLSLAGRNDFMKLIYPTVDLRSIHAAKGREAETVIVDSEMTKRTWDGYLKQPVPEHRVFYVAVTRAKQNLYYRLPHGKRAYTIV